VAVVIAGHGDRAGARPNRTLLAHAEAVRDLGEFGAVTAGVLKGEPSLETALQKAGRSGRILVYPFFMADGYFVRTVLRGRIRAAGLASVCRILAPLGLDPRIADVMLADAMRTAREGGLECETARLLVVGHGSKFGPASARATRRAAGAITRAGKFARVATAFLEEPPFLVAALAKEKSPTVVAGFFSGEGLHAAEDVPAAIRATTVDAVYAGAVGRAPAIPRLIVDGVRAAIAAEKKPQLVAARRR
jgi:sirohydrochlorin ferrochelatase